MKKGCSGVTPGSSTDSDECKTAWCAHVMANPVTTGTSTRILGEVRNLSPSTRRTAVAALVLALLLLAASRWNPLMTAAANNRLEAPCADPDSAGVTEVDRTAWTPLVWSCTVQRMDGGTETILPW